MNDSIRPPVWLMVKEAAEALGGKTTNVDVREWILRKYPSTNSNSISADIVFCTVNHPSRIHYFSSQASRIASGKHDFLYRTGRGKLEMYDPAIHGVWEMVRTEDGQLEVHKRDDGDAFTAGSVAEEVTPTSRTNVSGCTPIEAVRDSPGVSAQAVSEKLKKAILSCSELYWEHPRYGPADTAITKLFEAFPSLTHFDAVLLKVTVLNQLYATNIYDVISISRHIFRIPDLSGMIEKGNPEAVNSIRRGHGITSRGGKEVDVYSFATKFCAWHCPQTFPIFDNLVCRLLSALNRDFSFTGRFSQDRLRDYSVFKRICGDFCRWLSLPSDESKRVDAGVWLLATFRYHPERLGDELRAKVRSVAPGCI